MPEKSNLINPKNWKENKNENIVSETILNPKMWASEV